MFTLTFRNLTSDEQPLGSLFDGKVLADSEVWVTQLGWDFFGHWARQRKQGGRVDESVVTKLLREGKVSVDVDQTPDPHSLSDVLMQRLMAGGGGGGGFDAEDVYFIGPDGDDTSGDGSAGSPYKTMQKCYDEWFPAGHPTSWEEFDRKRTIVVLPGTTAATAGDLVAECANIVVTGHGEIGDVTYDVKSEVFATFTGASSNYESNTLAFVGGLFGIGFGYDSSSADALLKVGSIYLSNFNNVTREVKVALRACQASVRTQRRTDPGGYWTCPIYIDAIDCQVIYCESGVGTGARAGDMPMVWARAKDCNFRVKVDATGGAVGFADLADCYFRRGFEGDPGVAGMIATGTFRGWRDSYFKTAFDVSTAPAQTLQMDTTTYKYLVTNASPSWGLCDVQLDDVLAGPTGSRPGNVTAGTSWFDTTLGYPVWWDGAAWVDADGNPV